MKLNRILRSLRRNVVPALVAGAVLGLLTTLGSYLLVKPTYTASNQILFQVAGMEKVQDPSLATNYATTLASSYTSMVNQPVITVPLAETVELEQPVLAANLTVVSPRTNMLATISYKDADEAKATQVVTEAGKLLEQAVDQTTDKVGTQPRISVVQQTVNTLETPGSAPTPISSLMKGAMVGLMTLIAWLLVRALLDNKVRVASDLSELDDSSVLAELHEPQDAALLARAIPFLQLGEPARILLAAARDDDGAEATAVATAQALAADSRNRVLLVDADLRHGLITRQLGVSGPGLSEFLSGQTDVPKISRTDGLSVLSSGALPPNPAELLSADRFATLLGQAGDHTHIVVASSGLLDHSDAALCATAVGGTVLVTRAGSSRESDVREAVALLDSVHAPFAGLVLDHQPAKVSSRRK